MKSVVLTDTHPIDESYIEQKPQTNLEFCEFNLLSDAYVEDLMKKSDPKVVS